MRSLTTIRLLSVAAALAATACGGGEGTPAGIGSSASLALGVAPGTVSLRQGELSVVVASVNRLGGYTGPVTFAVEGAPAGLTVSVSTPSTVGDNTTAVMSLAASLTIPAGTYTLTVRAKGSGVSDATATLAVTIGGATAQYGLVQNSAMSIPAGGRDSASILVARAVTFTGPVALSLLNPPTGITGTFNPANVTGIQSWVIVNVAATVTPGTYPITVRGTVTGQSDATVTFQLAVTAGTAAGNVTIDLGNCAPARILWVAAQDGTGAWQRLTGANDLYRANVTSGKGGFAWVSDYVGWTALHVQYGTQAELTAAPFAPCQAQGTKIVSGSIAGLTSSEFAQVTYARGLVIGTSASPSVGMAGVRDGVHDLIGYRYAFPDVTTDRVIIRRDQNIANGGSFAVMNFGSGSIESVAAAQATLTVSGFQATESMLMASAYLTGPACDIALLKSWGPPTGQSGTSRAVPILGVPVAPQRASDYHEFAVGTSTSENLPQLLFDIPLSRYNPPPAVRVARLFFHTMADKTVALGANFGSAPTVTKLAPGGGTYKRLQAAFTIPADYQTSATLEYGAGPQGTQSATVTASLGWLGGTAATIAVPDFSAVAGWTSSWLPSDGTFVSWAVTATGSNVTTTQCVENGLIRTVRVVGGTN